jgi:hypothetical protein
MSCNFQVIGLPMITDLSYAEASLNTERTLIKGKALKADVFIASVRGSRFVVKDFGKKGFLERNLGSLGHTVRWQASMACLRSISGWALTRSPSNTLKAGTSAGSTAATSGRA